MKSINKVFLIGVISIISLCVTMQIGAYSSKETQSGENEETSGYISETTQVNCLTKDHINNRMRSSGFSYSDDMLFSDASSSENYDIAKISVSLMSAAYDSDSIISVLKNGMKYDVVSCYDYNRKATYSDNDFVAFSVAQKKVIKNGEVYYLYIVPVRGTPGSGEWYSNFRLGKNNGGNHEGFYKAAAEVSNVLTTEWFSKDGVNSDHRKILITGHSRGAAVANIVAGKLSDEVVYAKRNSIFGYTYACPAVSKNANTGYTNIYNYNNNSDVIPALPLETWGYKRYGQTIILDTSVEQYNNFLQRFKNETNATYKGTVSGSVDTFIATLSDYISSEAVYNSDEAQLAFDLVAFALGGKNDSELQPNAFLSKHGVALSSALLKKLDAGNVIDLLEQISDRKNENVSLKNRINEAIQETAKISTDEWETWRDSNSSLCSMVSEQTGVEITKKTDLQTAYSSIVAEETEIGKIGARVTDVVLLLVDSSGNPMTAITHGHAAITYELWINSMFFGYRGWYKNNTDKNVKIVINCGSTLGEECFYDCSAVEGVVFPSTISEIPDNCFYGCSGLGQMEIPEHIKTIGGGAFSSSGLEKLTINGSETVIGFRAFYYCENLKKVTLPSDILYEGNDIFNSGLSSFGGCPVTNIYYTKGKTGKIYNRNDSNGEVYISAANTLENGVKGTLETIEFEEGITEIGDHFFYGLEYQDEEGNFQDKYKKLKSIKFPSTLKRIGKSAFENIASEIALELPEGLEVIDEGAFYNGSGIKTVQFPSTISEIPDNCFYGCSGLGQVEILEHIKTIGGGAFSSSGLEKLTINGSETVIGGGAFGYCRNLKEVTLNGSETVIGFRAFYYCENLKKVTLPSDILYEGNDIFNSGLSSFSGCPVTSIYYTKGKTGKIYNRNDSNGEVHISADNTLEDGVKGTLETIEFEEGITEIGDYFFYDTNYHDEEGNSQYKYKKLKSIKLPSTLKRIGKHAFQNIESEFALELPEGLNVIDEGAFRNCSNIYQISIPCNFDKEIFVVNNSGIKPDETEKNKYFISNVEGEFVFLHDWSNKDGVCADGCGKLCDHTELDAQNECLECGKHIDKLTSISLECDSEKCSYGTSNNIKCVVAKRKDVANDVSFSWYVDDAEIEGEIKDIFNTMNLTVGKHIIRCEASCDDYQLDKTMELEITKAKAEIKNSDMSIVYDGVNHGVEQIVVAGVEGKEQPTGAVTCTYYEDEKCTIPTSKKNAGAENEGGEPCKVGKYYVVIQAESDSIYLKTEKTISMTILKRELTPVLQGNTTKEYDSNNSTNGDGLNLRLINVIEKDDVTAKAQYSYDNSSVGKGKKIIASNITLEGSDSSNYVLVKDKIEAQIGTITKCKVQIAVSKEELLIDTVKNNEKITVEISDIVDGKVVFQSLDETIVKVNDNGELTAVSEGNTEILVFVPETDNCEKSNEIHIFVTVKEPSVCVIDNESREYYYNLEDALLDVEQSKDKKTIELLKNIELSKDITLKNGSVLIELLGFEIKGSDQGKIIIAGANVTLQDSSQEEKGMVSKIILESGKLEIKSGTIRELQKEEEATLVISGGRFGSETSEEVIISNIENGYYYDQKQHKVIQCKSHSHADNAPKKVILSTCEQDGYSVYDCIRCHIEYQDDYVAAAHQLTKILEKSPTEQSEGNILYWHCQKCGKNYYDEKAEKEIVDTALIKIPKLAANPSNDTGMSNNSSMVQKNAVKPPKKVTISLAKSIKRKKISLSWKAVKKVKGYKIQVAANKKFKKSKNIMTNKTKYIVKKLKKKTYYVRICAYYMDGKKRVFGEWSKVKKIKVK